MLVISRYEGESFRIGPDVVVTIIQVRGGSKVRVGIEAPKDIAVLRTEIIESGKGDTTENNDTPR